MLNCIPMQRLRPGETVIVRKTKAPGAMRRRLLNLALVEDAGDLPRIAFNLDKPFCRCKACGKRWPCEHGI